ncbi:translation initiation factor IF-2-like [Triticum dicoccoides]|uniref:translation initiation factor IF-2-like n=1 Tax=Triticum dicoccoides TaxID=85692 RepID=UPI00188EEF45|nr:translation initiation factor IF-2-like [Triticum dicoccoides]
MEAKTAGKFGKQSLYMRHSMVHLPDDKERNYRERLLAAQNLLASARGDVSPHSGALASAAIPGSSSPAAPPLPRPQHSSKAEEDVSLHSGALAAPAAVAIPSSASSPAGYHRPKPTSRDEEDVSLHSGASAAAAAGAIPSSASSPAGYYRPKPTSRDTLWGGILHQVFDDKPPSSSSPGAPAEPKVSFTLRERDMMGCYYFRDFMETFVDMMYEQKDKQPWLGEILKSYERSLPTHGFIPHESIPDGYMLEEGDEDEEES